MIKLLQVYVDQVFNKSESYRERVEKIFFNNGVFQTNGLLYDNLILRTQKSEDFITFSCLIENTKIHESIIRGRGPTVYIFN